MGAKVIEVWGTWEELLLGGAVLRHGTRDWNIVAAELRARTACPYTFTPEVCKARYEDLQQRFPGRKAWFEELRKQRMAELRRALELSENSIGSLESKLKTLQAKRGNDCPVDYFPSQTELTVPFQKSEPVVSSSNGLSAGSFTRETRMSWSPESHIPASAPAEEMDAKPEVSLSSEQEKVSNIEKLTEISRGGQIGSLRRRRGKRKRKYCNRDLKGGSVGESDDRDVTDSLTVSRYKENSNSESVHVSPSSGVDDQSRSPREDSIEDLRRTFESVGQNESACVFNRRLDSQKRARYKRTILQHMDFDTISSRISSHSITSVKELFRDLLLLANNAVVFYSKNTREYKSALQLRAFVIKTLRKHFNEDSNKPKTSTLSLSSPTHKPPAKPQNAVPCSGKQVQKVANAGNVINKPPSRGKYSSDTGSPHSAGLSAVTKIRASTQAGTAARGRRRSRAR